MKRRDLRVKRGKTAYTFSVGEVVESLQGVGVPTDEAISIARGVEKHYRNEGNKKVKLDKLVERVAKALEDEVDKDTAERFRVQTPPFVPLRGAKRQQDNTFLEACAGKVLGKSRLALQGGLRGRGADRAEPAQ